jgi:MFS family permease
MVNPAFPALVEGFEILPETIRWAIIGYVFTYAVMSFVGGAAADRLGHGRVFRAGLGLSAIGFGAAGLAPAFGWFLVGRVVQGIGGGFVYGTGPGLSTLAAGPGGRGRALGLLNAAIGLGATLGPPVGGALAEALGWRAIFLARVPVALATLALAARKSPAPPAPWAARLVRLSDLARAPVLRPGLLAFAAYAGIFAIWLLGPFYLVSHRGFNATTGGLLLMLTPLGIVLGSLLAGWLTDRVGTRAPVAAGLGLEAAGLFLMSRADATTPAALAASGLFAAGLGLGIFEVPNVAALMGAFRATQQGAAGGFAFGARTLGIVAGVLSLAQIFAARRPTAGFQVAFAAAFRLAAGAVAVAAAVALFPVKGRG